MKLAESRVTYQAEDEEKTIRSALMDAIEFIRNEKSSESTV